MINKSSTVTANMSPNNNPIISNLINVKKPITTSPTAKDEWARRPSKASPGRLVLFWSCIKIKAIKEELDQSEEKCQKLELKIQYEEEKNQLLSDENGNLKTENKKNQEKILDLSEENRRLNDEVERLKMQIQNLTSGLEKLEAENLRLKDDIDAKNAAIENIRKEVIPNKIFADIF